MAGAGRKRDRVIFIRFAHTSLTHYLPASILELDVDHTAQHSRLTRHSARLVTPHTAPRDGSQPAAMEPEAPAASSACFRGCCISSAVPLAVPKDEFTTNLREVHDGPASAVFLGRWRGNPVAVKKPKLPTKAGVSCSFRACRSWCTSVPVVTTRGDV